MGDGSTAQKRSSVQFSHSVVSNCLQPHESQHARSPCPSPTPGVHSDSRPLSRWCHPAILSSAVPFSSCPPIPPRIRVFSNESTLRKRWPNYWSSSFSIYSFQRTPRADLLQNGLVGSPCSPWDSQESSPTPQFKSINSSALSFLHSPTLTSIHDYQKYQKRKDMVYYLNTRFSISNPPTNTLRSGLLFLDSILAKSNLFSLCLPPVFSFD